MAELHSNIYYKHPKPEVMEKLKSFFLDCQGDKEKLISTAVSINRKDGGQLARNLISSVSKPEHDLDAESMQMMEGYYIAHFVHGGNGDDIVEDIIKFLYALAPDIHAQAWGCGDDDPWEFWIRYENNQLIRNDDEPLMDDDEDQELLDTVYTWWHEPMPASITEGLLNDNDELDVDLDDEYIVFTGKMEHGTRSDMEEIAEQYGANVQKSINKKTTILVVGDRPGESKLTKANALNIRIITESDFDDIVGSDYDDEEKEIIATLSNFPGFESLKDLHIDKASDALRLIGKNSFAGISFSIMKEFREFGIEAQQDAKSAALFISQRSTSAVFLIEDYNGGLDVDFNDVAAVALDLGLTTQEEVHDRVDKKYHLNPEGTKWEWEIDDFKCELKIRLSPHTDNNLFYSCKYKPKK